MKVEMFSQYGANTVSFEGDDELYLRLAAESRVVWYKTDDHGTFRWVPLHGELEQAWLGRNNHEVL
mgnify:FL=1